MVEEIYAETMQKQFTIFLKLFKIEFWLKDCVTEDNTYICRERGFFCELKQQECRNIFDDKMVVFRLKKDLIKIKIEMQESEI